MLSQGGEEQVLQDYFLDHQGRFLDLGAFTGPELSNTWPFLARGWTGVLVEASPQVFAQLQQNVAPYREQVDLVCAVIDPEGDSPLVEFHDTPHAVGTISPAIRDKWAGHEPIPGRRVTYDPIHLATISPSDLIHAFGDNFDLVSIDLEGQSVETFSYLLGLGLTPSAWVVEHDGLLDTCRGIALPEYKEAYCDPNNIIFVQ